MLPLAILVAIYLYLEEKSYKNSAYFTLGVLLMSSVLIFYVIKLDILADFYFWTIEFNLTTFSEMGTKSPTIRELLRSAPLFGAAGLAWVLLAKRELSRELGYLGIFFTALLAFAYARFDFVHLQPALPFAVMIIVIFARRHKVISSLLFPMYLLISLVLISRFYIGNYGTDVRFFGAKEDKIAEQVLLHTTEGQPIFALGTTPHIYQLTGTRPSGDIFVFQFPWFMTEAEDKVLSALVREPPEVVIRDLSATTGGQSLAEHMPNVSNYVEKNYNVVSNVDEVEIMIPK